MTTTADTTLALKSISEDLTGFQTWSDSRRNEFVDLFNQRTRASAYVIAETAKQVAEAARERRYIGTRHYSKMALGLLPKPRYDAGTDRYGVECTIGGRSVTELNRLVGERVVQIIKELPALKDAVLVIDPATSKKMGERDKLLAKARGIKEEIDELSEEIDMADHDEMLVSEFRAMVKERAKKKIALINKLNEIGTEGVELEKQIAKALYAGLPGLSDSVVKVVTDMIEQVKLLDQMFRRVEEQVKFGDSDAALELLRRFEKDEEKLSVSVKEQFSKAMQTLREAAKKQKKQLKKGAES